MCSFYKNRLRHRILCCVVFTKIEKAQTFFRNPFVQVLYSIVQIPDFTFCSLWLKSKADTIAYLVIITYLLSNSQRQCVSTAYNALPGVSQLFEPWTIYNCMYLYSCAALLVCVFAFACFPSFIIYIIPREGMVCLIGHLVLNTIYARIRSISQNIWNGIDFWAFGRRLSRFCFCRDFSVFCFFLENSCIFLFYRWTSIYRYIDIWMDR